MLMVTPAACEAQLIDELAICATKHRISRRSCDLLQGLIISCVRRLSLLISPAKQLRSSFRSLRGLSNCVPNVDKQAVKPVTAANNLRVEEHEREEVYYAGRINISIVRDPPCMFKRVIQPPSGALVQVLQHVKGEPQYENPNGQRSSIEKTMPPALLSPTLNIQTMAIPAKQSFRALSLSVALAS
jgi:hypothetical protein